jgi:MFS family permease
MNANTVSKQRGVNFKFTLLAFLYVTQYLPLAFFSVVLPVILRQAGVGYDKIGVLYLITIPWLLKFLWAPLVDKYGSKTIGHYKIWIIVMQTVLVFSCIMLSTLSPIDDFYQLLLWGSISCLASATQDIATDATAVNILDETQRSVGNGIQSAAGLLSHLLGGGVLLILYKYLQWKGCMIALASIIALPVIIVLMYKEINNPQAFYKTKKVHFIEFFHRKGMKRWILLLVIAIASISLSHGLLPPLLVDANWDNMKIAVSIALLGGLTGAASSIIMGKVMQKTTRKKALVYSILIQACLLSGILIPIYNEAHIGFSYLGITLSYFGYGLAVTALYTVNMDNCKKETAGSDYSLQDCIGNFGQIAIHPLALFFVGIFGYSRVIAVGIGFGVLAAIVVAKLFSHKTL